MSLPANVTGYFIKAGIKSGVPLDAFYFGYGVRNELFYGDSLSGTPQDTRELINEQIPTFEEIGDSYLFEQGVQEGISRVYGVKLPWQLKLALEVYGFYDYFLND